MYDHFRGRVSTLELTRLVVDVGGVGYELSIPISTFERLKGEEDVTVLAHVHVREDALRLFGFATHAERELFRLVLSVAGVGPGIALAALSALSPHQAASALADGDLKTLQRVKGVGKKLAERLVLELRERVGVLLATFAGQGEPVDARQRAAERASLTGPADDPMAEDAVKALVELGYERRTAAQKVEAAAVQLGDAASVEALVRLCLVGG